MAKIFIRNDPEKFPACQLDTQTSDVEILDAFLGVVFVTKQGERLAVCMRDNGFEVHYYEDHKQFDEGWFEFKNGKVQRMVEVT